MITEAKKRVTAAQLDALLFQMMLCSRARSGCELCGLLDICVDYYDKAVMLDAADYDLIAGWRDALRYGDEIA